MLHFILILLSTPNIKSVTVDIDGSIDLGPEWKYKYEIHPQPEKHYRAERKHIFDIAAEAGSEIFNLIKNIQNGESNENNRTVPAELEFETENKTTTTNVTDNSKKSSLREDANHKSDLTDESTEDSDISISVKNNSQNNYVRTENNNSEVTKKSKEKGVSTENSDFEDKAEKKVQNIDVSTEDSSLEEAVKKKSEEKGVSIEGSDLEKKDKKKFKGKGVSHKKSDDETVKKKSKLKGVSTETSDLIEDFTKRSRFKVKSTTKSTKKEKRNKKREKPEKTKLTTRKPITYIPLTTIVPRSNNHMFIKPIRVKDDATLTEHIQHIYKQTLKVFDDLKNKMDNYRLKKEIKLLSRSYDEKFKEFVKENKYHLVKSRLGKKKVILNAAETSNKILDRLNGYLKSKVQTNGLRSNVPNFFEKELHKKIVLENKRMCKKFGICRSGNGFRHFLIEAFNIILNSGDAKIKQANDAATEVLKNRDFSKYMDKQTEKQFLRGLRDFENYGIDILKPIYYIMRNIIVNINEPLKVTNRDKQVNKTVAFIEFIDVFDEKMVPNEENKLSWNDMLNALRSWSNNQRYDINEIGEMFIDQIVKAIDGFEPDASYQIQRNFKILMN